MTDYRTVAPGEYLGAIEFGGLGKTRAVTLGSIGRAKKKNQHGIEQEVFRISIGNDRYWIVNRGNQDCLAAMFGEHIEGWVGKTVVLVSEASDKSDTGQAIRVAGSPHLKADIEATLKDKGKTLKRKLRRIEV